MGNEDLLMRLMQRDTDAYMEMTEKYSWPVYTLIRQRISDKNKVEAVFQETMNGFYKGLYENASKDPVEAMLLLYADKVCQGDSGEPAPLKPELLDLAMPKTETPKPEPSESWQGNVIEAPKVRRRKRRGFFYYLFTAVLLLGILAASWVIFGLLMSLQIIPRYDIGYSWFNVHIFPWF